MLVFTVMHANAIGRTRSTGDRDRHNCVCRCSLATVHWQDLRALRSGQVREQVDRDVTSM
jgi:hypothetical protein